MAPTRATASEWRISTIAGTGVAGSTGDGSQATSAQVNDPYGIVRGPDAGLLAGGGVTYAAWDDAGYGLRPIEAAAWAGVVIAVAVGGLRGGVLRRSSR